MHRTLLIAATASLLISPTALAQTAGTYIDGMTGVTQRAQGVEVTGGGTPSGTADAGSPVKIGGVFNTTLPVLTTGQRGDVQMDTRGGLITVIKGTAGTSSAGVLSPLDAVAATNGLVTNSQGVVFNGTTWDRQRGDTNGTVSTPGLTSTYWNYAAAASGIVNTTTAVTIRAAAGASIRIYLKTLTIDTDTLGAATELVVRDGAAGTVMWRGKLQTAAASGRTVSFDPPLRGTANTLMEVATLTATVTGGVFVNATGFTGN